MRVIDVRCYPTAPDKPGEEGLVTVAFRVGEMYFSFRLPLGLAWVTYGRLGEALTKLKRTASTPKQGEGGKGAESEGRGEPSAP